MAIKNKISTFTFMFILFIVSVRTNEMEMKNIFILAGQSNMVGRDGLNNHGGLDFKKIPLESQPNPFIFRFTANLSWEKAHEPLHEGIDKKSCGIGPGMPFSNAILKRNASFGVIGLVPCAIGDTSIIEWSRGAQLYLTMLARAEAALSGGGVIRAILWFQGEKDTVDEEAANLYRNRFEKFIADVRSDLHLPSLPFIEVALPAEVGNKTLVDKVRTAQLQTPNDLENVKCVDAKGLPLIHFDYVHLTISGQVALGSQMAETFIKGGY